MESICETSPQAMSFLPAMRKRSSSTQLALGGHAGSGRETQIDRLLQLLSALGGVAAVTGRRVVGQMKLYLHCPPPARTWGFGYDYTGKCHYDQPMVILSFRSPLSTTVIICREKKI